MKGLLYMLYKTMQPIRELQYDQQGDLYGIALKERKMTMKNKTLCLIAALLGGLGLVLPLALILLVGQAVSVRAYPGVLYVASGGNCGGANPCYGSVQAAVDAASSDDEIRVAAGTYAGVSARASVTQVVYIDKSVAIRGGYITTDWTTPDPGANLTILDAENAGRVLYVTGNISTTIEGLHITGGNASNLGGPWNDADVGGGVYVYTATVTISDCVVYGNTASTVREGDGGGILIYGSDAATLIGNMIRNNRATTAFDAYSGGGGLAISSSTATLKDNVIRDNVSAAAGGYSSGGGLAIWSSTALLEDNTVTGNLASTGGSYDDYGGGIDVTFSIITLRGNTIVSNTTSEGWYGAGGGIGIRFSDGVTLSHNLIAGNTAGVGEQGVGGGVYISRESKNVWLSNNVVRGNTANTQEKGWGGGLYISGAAAITLRGNAIVGNVAALNLAFAGSGGGLYVGGSNPFTLTNNVVADNHANTQGSGLTIRGDSDDPTFGRLLHTTIADNRGSEQGVYVGDSTTLAFINTIIAGHNSTGVTVTAGSTVTLEATLWHDNGLNTAGGGTIITGTVNVIGEPAFADPPAWDYHLTGSSVAIDRGVMVGVSTDIDGQHRPYGSAPDLGADEIIAVAVSTDTRGVLVYTDTQGSPTVIQAPADAVTAATALALTPLDSATPPAGFSFAGHAFQLEAYRDGTLLAGFAFEKPITITIHYSAVDVAGLDEDSLDLRYWDGSNWVSAGITLVERNPAQRYATFTVAHLSEFALFGETQEQHLVYLPLVVR